MQKKPNSYAVSEDVFWKKTEWYYALATKPPFLVIIEPKPPQIKIVCQNKSKMDKNGL